MYITVSLDIDIDIVYVSTGFDSRWGCSVPCQYQKGSKDCGLYAIAWAYELANGNRPECIAFEQTRMRAHLMACFEKRKMSHFPLTNEGKQPRKDNSTT